jgi:fimbrial chaperone protein
MHYSKRLAAGMLAAVLALFAQVAASSGLEVSPVMLTLEPQQNADGLWLSNIGTNLVQAQIRVYRWTQADGQDTLDPTRDLLASPPMLQVAANSRQLIRVIRLGAPPAGPSEQAYRIIVDELPISMDGKRGIQFVLKYSIPVFVAGAGAAPSGPRLAWQLRREGTQTVLEVTNSGDTHAQLASLLFINSSGHRTDVHPGLLGYVLPGSQMRWHLRQPPAAFAGGGTFEAMVNGGTIRQNVAPAVPAR